MLRQKKIERYKFIKRFFDLFFAVLGIFVLSPLIFVLVFISSLDTKSFGIFTQKRVGYKEKLFSIYKIRTYPTTIPYLPSMYGRFLRKSKLDELPQLLNILKGDMSFVGPRPDIPGYADKLGLEDKVILSVKPGLTGPASIMFKNEEYILSKKISPVKYNKLIIWPMKVKLNVNYVKNMSFINDVYYLLKTFI